MKTINKRIAYLVLGAIVLILAACSAQPGQIPETGGEATPPTSPIVPPEAVQSAQQWLAEQLSVAVERVQIIEVEQSEWSDSCLGLGRPDESCAQVITPGWRAVFEIDGRRYEVRTDETGSNIRLATPADTPAGETGLENTNWRLVSFGPQGAEEPLVEGSAITLMFGGGQAGGSGGCNSYGGEYRVEGNQISFGTINSTLIACADERVTEQERRYFEALEAASSYEINGDQLLITYAGGRLIFERSSAIETPSN